MTNLQLYHFNYVLNQLSKRILPIYFYNHNKAKMCEWQNQICLQCHVIAAYYLDKYLTSEYDITLYEGIFTDKVHNTKYNHSWLFIEKVNDGFKSLGFHNYLCDIARVSAHIGLVNYDNIPSAFIEDKEHEELRKKHNWKELFQQNEYYTNKTGPEIIKDIDQMLIDAKLSFTQYK